jgi:hypothetical protein
MGQPRLPESHVPTAHIDQVDEQELAALTVAERQGIGAGEKVESCCAAGGRVDSLEVREHDTASHGSAGRACTAHV